MVLNGVATGLGILLSPASLERLSPVASYHRRPQAGDGQVRDVNGRG